MTLYEDRIAKATLAENAATQGHIIIQPQRDVKKLAELKEDECAHLFVIASYTAAILFQGLQAEGTNIIVNEGDERLTVHVIARRNGDGLDFQWPPKEIDEGTMNDVFERVKDKAFYVGKQQAESDASPTEEAPPKPEDPDKENYLIKHLIKSV